MSSIKNKMKILKFSKDALSNIIYWESMKFSSKATGVF